MIVGYPVIALASNGFQLLVASHIQGKQAFFYDPHNDVPDNVATTLPNPCVSHLNGLLIDIDNIIMYRWQEILPDDLHVDETFHVFPHASSCDRAQTIEHIEKAIRWCKEFKWSVDNGVYVLRDGWLKGEYGVINTPTK